MHKYGPDGLDYEKVREMEALPLLMMGTQVAGGIAEKSAANKAAAAAARVGVSLTHKLLSAILI